MLLHEIGWSKFGWNPNSQKENNVKITLFELWYFWSLNLEAFFRVQSLCQYVQSSPPWRLRMFQMEKSSAYTLRTWNRIFRIDKKTARNHTSCMPLKCPLFSFTILFPGEKVFSSVLIVVFYCIVRTAPDTNINDLQLMNCLSMGFIEQFKQTKKLDSILYK